jgi:Uma2 family endonuclease
VEDLHASYYLYNNPMSIAHAVDRTNSIAPWAEIVATDGPVTVDSLLTLPDDAYVYEVVEGVLVRVAGSGQQATTIAAILIAGLYSFVRPRRLGVITSSDGVYKFPGAETGLIPDVGFYLAARAAQIVDRHKPIPFAPDLAVEVASPQQTRQDMAAKARLYLAGGTSLVWVVWPDRQEIDVWRRSPQSSASSDTVSMHTLRAGDLLDGEAMIPSFSYPVADIFADPLPLA